jgi:ABC-type Fe3+ transport system permease subunit/DNA-binding beta-propeller fold protein YncE
LCCICLEAFRAEQLIDVQMPQAALLGQTVFLSIGVATCAMLLGYLPGRLLGSVRRYEGLILLLLLMPLVLPRYVLYYAWSLLLAPTSFIGDFLSRHPQMAQQIGSGVAQAVLVSWYWPLAALVMAQGWRSLDRNILDHALLESGGWSRYTRIVFPHLSSSVMLAFGICFILSLSEFTTYHLAGIKTLGTGLAVFFELTGSAGLLARACWPISILACLLILPLRKWVRTQDTGQFVGDRIHIKSQPFAWCLFVLLLMCSLIMPLLLLMGHLNDFTPVTQLYSLYLRGAIFDFPQTALDWSLVASVASAVIALLLATATLFLLKDRGWRGIVGRTAEATLLLVMLLPGSLIGVSVLHAMQALHLPPAWRQSWLVVSVGCALRYAGAALLLQSLLQKSQLRATVDMANVDGAGPVRTWWYVLFPQQWGATLGLFILLVMLSMSEIATTGILLPPGLPNFAQLLLNQMHYARDQQVIALCLVLILLFLVMAAILIFLFRMASLRSLVILGGACLISAVPGCEKGIDADNRPEVLTVFGGTGRGPGEFHYPRAISMTSDGDLFVVDKTGRIQTLTTDGRHHSEFQMPQIETGLPTGITLGPTGRLFVADTHYSRIMIFDSSGEVLTRFGSYGEGEGQFIYPTDVAVRQNGDIFVSEYGGNDRISVFSSEFTFLYAFGASGSGEGEFSRPSALCLDEKNRHLYVADACNHRIGVYDYKGNLLRYIGSPGRGKGQLHYPYDLAWLDENRLVVCEYGNNRLQLYDVRGQSLAVIGEAGREPGQLAYPWGVCVDDRGRAYVVDSGNDRVQVWQL